MARVTLRSGREVDLRPVRPDDAGALSAAYDRLSPESKYQRFLAPKAHLTSNDLRYLTEVDGESHVAFVATPVDRPDDIIGVARYVRLPENSAAAEFAVTIGDPYQGEGLGTALVECLADAAHAHGIILITATVLAGNVAAHRLLNRLAGRLARERHLGIVDEIEFDLAA
jgi:RimJ/RimL family protein N-acetyltransferase